MRLERLDAVQMCTGGVVFCRDRHQETTRDGNAGRNRSNDTDQEGEAVADVIGNGKTVGQKIKLLQDDV